MFDIIHNEIRLTFRNEVTILRILELIFNFIFHYNSLYILQLCVCYEYIKSPLEIIIVSVKFFIKTINDYYGDFVNLCSSKYLLYNFKVTINILKLISSRHL